jgi:hypothetical protein
MMVGNTTLLREENIISLRTASVNDDGDLVFFLLMSPSMTTPAPGTREYRRATWLYRRRRSFFGELKLKRGFFPVEQNIRPVVFAHPPHLRLLWSDSGHSVALFLNGEPWAFIHEEKNHGYSKGILKPTTGNPWDQALFEETFLVR